MPLTHTGQAGANFGVEWRRGLQADMQMTFMKKLTKASIVNRLCARKDTDGENEVFQFFGSDTTPGYGGAIPTELGLSSYKQTVQIDQYKTSIPIPQAELRFSRAPMAIRDAISVTFLDFWTEWELKDCVVECMTGTRVNLQPKANLKSFNGNNMFAAVAGHVGNVTLPGVTGNVISGRGWTVPAIQKDVLMAMALFSSMLKPNTLRYWDESVLSNPGLIIVCSTAREMQIKEAVLTAWNPSAYEDGTPMNASQQNIVREIYKPEVYGIPEGYLGDTDKFFLFITNTQDRPKPITIVYNTKSPLDQDQYDLKVVNDQPTFYLYMPDPNDVMMRRNSIFDPTMEFWANPVITNHHACVAVDNTGL